MSDYYDLYKEVILDHSKHPRNNARLLDYTHLTEVYNSLCGDSLILYLKIENNLITNIGWTGEGCAISRSTASLLSIELLNKEIIFAQSTISMLEANLLLEEGPPELLTNPKLEIISNVRNYPSRIKCAITPLSAYRELLL